MHNGSISAVARIQDRAINANFIGGI